jgi:hypothetical protein
MNKLIKEAEVNGALPYGTNLVSNCWPAVWAFFISGKPALNRIKLLSAYIAIPSEECTWCTTRQGSRRLVSAPVAVCVCLCSLLTHAKQHIEMALVVVCTVIVTFDELFQFGQSQWHSVCTAKCMTHLCSNVEAALPCFVCITPVHLRGLIWELISIVASCYVL